MKNRFPIALFFLALTILCSGIHAEDQKDTTLSPYFFVQGDPTLDQLPLKDTHVDIAISGVIADVTIRQVYKNEGTRPINARYVFPASTRAAVYGMRMQIDDQVIVAKIKEREKAKQEFQKAKEAGKSASLLEQNRPNVFSMNVANIVPGDKVEIELRYTELLIPTDRIYELVFPTVVGPRYSSQHEATAPDTQTQAGTHVPQGEKWVKTPYLREGDVSQTQFHLRASVSSGVPIQDFQCASHEVKINWKNPKLAHLQLSNENGEQPNRDFILRYRLAGEQITSGLMLYEGKDENFFLFMAQPPARIADQDIPPREYIFVVDISGSMHGFPLNISKQLLRDLIGKLRPSDTFNVVLFAGSSQQLSPQSIPALPENVAKAISVIDSQAGGGGTELLDAIKRAMNIPRVKGISRNIVLVTDGYITGEAGAFDYIRDHLNEANVFSFGIGSSVNRYLIEGIARAGRGEPFIITHHEEAPAIATKFREYIQTPVLSNVRLQWNGFEAYDVEPAVHPELFADRPIIVFGKWRGARKGKFELEGITGRGLFRQNFDVSSAQTDESNRALRYLWARTRIAELSDYGPGVKQPDSIAAITALGLQYNLLTQHTSFIAVREIVRNSDAPAKDVDQPLPLPLGVSNSAVGGAVTSGSEPGLTWMLVLFSMIGAGILYRRLQAFH